MLSDNLDLRCLDSKTMMLVLESGYRVCFNRFYRLIKLCIIGVAMKTDAMSLNNVS